MLQNTHGLFLFSLSLNHDVGDFFLEYAELAFDVSFGLWPPGPGFDKKRAFRTQIHSGLEIAFAIVDQSGNRPSVLPAVIVEGPLDHLGSLTGTDSGTSDRAGGNVF